MPLITTLAGASARGYGGLLASAAMPAFESIATYTVGAGGISSFSFTSIPQTYSHLQIRGIGKDKKTTVGWQDLELRFNSDGGLNYNSHGFSGNGSTTSADWSGNTNIIQIANALPTSATGETSMFGGCIIDILDYSNANKYTTTRALFGWDKNTSGQARFHSGLWRSTAAITAIRLSSAGDGFAQYTTFALYGIKGAQ